MALFKTFRGQRTDLDNVAKVDGHAYFCMDDGTFWIDYKDNGEVKRKQINKEDWTKDIQAAVAALKSEIEEELVNKTDYLGAVSSPEELSTTAGNGDYHRVAQEFQFGDEVAHVGDLLIALINLPAQTPEYWDLIHTGATVQVDYEQNDENAQDYIKNRPFYSERREAPVEKIYTINKNTILDCPHIQYENSSWGPTYWVKISDDRLDSSNFINGEIAIFDKGQNYVSLVQSDMIITGEGYFKIDISAAVAVMVITDFQQAAKTLNLPFTENGLYIDWWEGFYAYITSIKVYNILSEVEIIIKLDEKYIPDSIARVSDIPDIPDIPEVDQTYNAKSKNAQSGIAVAEAVTPIERMNIEQNSRLAELEGKVAIATFNIIEAGTTITLENLIGMTQIDWNDGTIDSNLTHTYTTVGEYECKIYDITSIGNGAFASCDNLTSVVIGDSVMSIGERAFHACNSLISVEIGESVTSISSSAFAYCHSLTEMQFNAIHCADFDSSNSAFAYAGKKGTGITVTFGDRVKYIPAYLFYASAYDPSYKPNIIGVVIGEGVTSIGEYAFGDCDSLTNVIIPSNVTSIGNGAFSACSSLTSVVIGDGVTSIGPSAFANCSSLTSVVIPDSVTSIGDSAFANCSSLTSIVIPDSVTSIGSDAFTLCESLTSVEIGDGVTMIGEEAFQYCESLTSVEIPDSVTMIGEGAFKGCSSLESITIPFVGGSRKTASDTYQYPFGYIFGISNYTGGTKTTQYYYGSSTSSTTSTTYYIPTSLKSVTITGGNILRGAFYYCSSLTSITIPDSVTSIGESAFQFCKSLTSIEIPNSVTMIGKNAFYGCLSLTSIEIPDSVTSIGSNAFLSCDSLASIEIPDSVTSIGGDAFLSCDSLTKVEFQNSFPIDYNSKYPWFNNCSLLTHIYVPYECKQAYIDKWTADGATQDILDKIVESDREAYMSDINAFKTEIQEQLVSKTDYLGTVTALPYFLEAGAGDYCRVSTEFIYDEATGEIAHVGDILIAIKDNPIQSITDWDLVHTGVNIDDLAPVAKSGLIEDLSMLWDTELIFDGGSADVQLAILDETILL